MKQNAGAARLRELIDQPGIIVTPGVYDCLSAKLAEAAGFSAIGVSGAAVTASALGRPDLGFLTMTEMADRLESIVDSVTIPIIADAETGFGGVLNVMRTVATFERIGVAGLFLEDQVQERRCGHFADKEVIPVADMQDKIRAAVRARRDPAFLIMARTDARDVEGLDRAIERGRAYAAAGADSLFVESPATGEELVRIVEELSDLGLPLKANMAEGGNTPLYSVSELHAMGYKFAHYPGGSQKVAIRAMEKFFHKLRTDGDIADLLPEHMVTLDERSELLELDRYLQIEQELRSDLPTPHIVGR